MQEQIILTQTTKDNLIQEILEGVQTLLKESQDKDLLKNEWLTAKEVMAVLKITAVTLWNYDQKGLTKPQKVGNRKRYHKPDILEILTKKEAKRA